MGLCTVRSVEHLGSETIIYLETDGPAFTVKSPRVSDTSVGDNVRMSVAPDLIYAFSLKDGRRV